MIFAMVFLASCAFVGCAFLGMATGLLLKGHGMERNCSGGAHGGRDNSQAQGCGTCACDRSCGHSGEGDPEGDADSRSSGREVRT